MWSYREHQVEGAEWVLATVRQYGLAYLSWQERTGKTGTAIKTIENSKAKTCLIVTKKKAIDGWLEAIENFPTTKEYTVINYESIHKIEGDFDFIVLDEAHHAISSTGRPSLTWKKVYKLVKGKPIIYLSATPYAESLGLIFHQLKLSHRTPFKHRNFYDFFREYGIPNMTRTPYGLQEQYNKYKNEAILNKMWHLFSFKKRSEVGIEHEPQINLVKIPLHDDTKLLMKHWLDRRVIMVDGHEVLGDSDSKLRSLHYMLESGVINAQK